MSLLDESLTIFRELGMRPLMERVLSRREILEPNLKSRSKVARHYETIMWVVMFINPTGRLLQIRTQ